MKFFKKLLGVGSKRDVRRGGKGGSSNSFVARSPRVRLTELHRIAFFPKASTSEESLKISNISIRGMGLWNDGSQKYKVNEEIAGLLTVDQSSFEVNASVRHYSNTLVGCLFTGANVHLEKTISEYLRLEILGMSLNRVDNAFLKPDPRGKVAWFTDARRNEVFCVTDPEGIVAFHITFLGNYVEGGRMMPLRVAFTKEDDSGGEPRHKGSVLLEFSLEVSPDTIELARTLVRNIDKMPSDIKSELERILQPK